MLTYIWIEGEQALKEFCLKRFGRKPDFMETIGHVDIATIENIYIYKEEQKNYVDMYLMYMEHPNGKITYNDINDIRGMSYEEIRAIKNSILRR
jgi:hypothetical protein